MPPDPELVPASRLRGLITEKDRLTQSNAELTARIEELEAANLGDLEKAQRDAKKAAEERDAAVASVADMTSTLADVQVRSHFSDATDPADVAKLVPADLVELGDDRTLTKESRAALDKWKKAKAYLFGDDGHPEGGAPAPRASDSGKSLAEQFQEAIEKGDTATASKLHARIIKGEK